MIQDVQDAAREKMNSADIELFDAMVEAGESVLADLAGEASNGYLATEVFRAMARVGLPESHQLVLLFGRDRW